MHVDTGSAVVTGGASGLGLATATELRRRGAAVVIADLPTSAGQQQADAIGATFAPVDVTDEQSMQAAIDAATAHGPLRALVTCAGIGTPGRVVSRGVPMPLEQFERVVRVNLVGTFNAIRLATLAMLTNEPSDGDRGVIVTTASVAAFDGQVGQVAYSASKGGVVGMVLPVARDLADKFIRIACIAPGTFQTPMLAGLPQETQDSLAAQVPHPSRLGDPSEFAALVGHIIDNGMINGEVIRLDGAIRMAPR
ncbi:MAG TPA: SDR family NAD(P)-dependent oxidoreductase [Jatrophihabitantaceae bacterium]|jgi:NAD(P)-dependent dehydrogenase (short-subunit alcohol dehydrogenase family)